MPETLKILAGLHRGAETSLTPGELVIGSDRDCDVILGDAGVAARHLRLRLTNRAVRLAAIDSAPVKIAGKPLGDVEIELRHFAPVEVGECIFAVGPSGEAWPDIAFRSPLRPGAEQSQPVAAKKGGGPIRYVWLSLAVAALAAAAYFVDFKAALIDLNLLENPAAHAPPPPRQRRRNDARTLQNCLNATVSLSPAPEAAYRCK